MDIYVFASNTLTNIWAGIGAETWAVAPAVAGSAHEKGRITKAQRMPVGSFGILYCSETKELTTPFVVYSSVYLERAVADIWEDEWVLPFKIKPLGNAHRRMSINEAKEWLPTFAGAPTMPPFNHVFRVRADFAFQTSQISEADWEILLRFLVL